MIPLAIILGVAVWSLTHAAGTAAARIPTILSTLKEHRS